MKFSRWIILAYLASAGAFTAGPFVAAYKADNILGLPTPTLLLAGGYCLLCVVLLAKSRGAHRTVMLLASLTILVSYVFRILVLMFNETALELSHLKGPSDVVDVVLTSDAGARALWFMVAGTAAFWLGGKLVVWSQLARRIDREDTGISRLFPHRAHLLVIGLAVASTVLVINVTIGTRWIGGEDAYLMRVLPIGIMPFVLMHLAVGHWKSLTPVEKVGLVVFFVILFLGGVAVGSRSAPFSAVLPWLTAVIVVGRDPKILVKYVVVGGLALVLALPGILGMISIVRDLVRTESMVLVDLPLFELWRESGSDLYAAFDLVSARAGSFDPLVLVMNYRPAGIEPHLTLVNLIAVAVDGFVPDRIWSSGAAPTGSVFAVYYQGFPWGAAHHGAFSGFGFFYVYFGLVLGIIGLAVLGSLATMILSILSRGPGLLQIVVASFVYNTVFLGFVSGNFDLIIPDFLIQGIIAGGLLLLVTMPDRAVGAKYSVRQLRHPTSGYAPKGFFGELKT